MLGSTQSNVLIEFYEKVLQKKPDMVEGEWAGFVAGNGFLGIGPHSKMTGKAKDPGRVMFNFEITEVKEEFERIKAIPGAEVVKEPYEMGGAWICTLADPDGNYFQLMTPWEEGK